MKMILLELEETTLLPKGQVFKLHNLCALLYEQLKEVMTSRVYDGLKETNFSYEGLPTINGNPDVEELLEILVQNNRKSEVTDFVAKHITLSILHDFIQFIYESLDAMRHARFSVAYALLRKSFVDELFMFEQILADKEEFIQRYYFQGDVDLYDPSNAKRFDKIKKSIMESAVNKLRFPTEFNIDSIYDIRYNKSAKFGMNWVSNQAIHIVTTDSRYKTLNKYLNFIFANDADRDLMFRHYYSVALALLNYSVAIIDKIVFGFLPEQKHREYIKATKRGIIVAYKNSIIADNEESIDRLTDILSQELKHTCKMCETINEFGDDRFQNFVFNEELNCSGCGTNQMLDAEFKDKFLALG